MITNKYLIFFKLKNMVFHKLSTFKKKRKKTKSVKKKTFGKIRRSRISLIIINQVKLHHCH